MGKFNYFPNKRKKFAKLSPTEQEGLVFDLIHAFAQANTPADSALLLQDLLTESEIGNLAKRLRIAKLLLSGETHEEIVTKTHSSYATIAKVNIWLNNSEGLKKVISRLPKRTAVPQLKKTPGVGYTLDQILLYYASAYLQKKEKERTRHFLESTRSKAADDRDLREEINLHFANKRLKKRRA